MMRLDMVLEIGLFEKLLQKVLLIGRLKSEIKIYGDDREMRVVMIMIIEIKNIQDRDHVQEVIMFQVYESGIN